MATAVWEFERNESIYARRVDQKPVKSNYGIDATLMSPSLDGIPQKAHGYRGMQEEQAIGPSHDEELVSSGRP